MISEIAGPDEYKKRQESIKKAIGEAVKKSPTQILKSQMKGMDTEAKKETQMKCEMSRMVFNEGLDMFEKGDMTYAEFVDDLSRSLKAIAGMKSEKGDTPPSKSDEYEKEE
jgi:hypothetical protein